MLNLVADLEIEGFKNFICAHYAFSDRDTPYWKYVANEVDYDMSTAELDNLFVRYSSEKHVVYEWLGDPSHNDGLRYVGAGMGFNPLNNHTLRLKRIQNGLSPIRDQHALYGASTEIDNWNQRMYDWCQTLPSSYQYQKQTIYKE
jgi:tryptophan halogenase